MIAPLRHREFRLLFGGQLVSNLGDWIDFLALAVLIAYVWQKGSAALAALAIVIAAPWIFVAPFAGVLADRWPRRMTMVGADLARAGLVIGLVFAPNLYVLLALVGAKTVFSTLFRPAQQAAIRTTVPESELHAANALSQFATQGTKVLGPTLSGLLVAATTPRVAFVVDAATFVCSAVILSRLGPVDVAPEQGEAPVPGRFLEQLREGLAYIVTRRALLVATIGFAGAIFLLLAFDSLSPLAFRELGVGRALFGAAIGAIGLGGAAGAFLVGRFAADINPFALMGGANAVIGGLVALMGLALLTSLDAPTFVWTPVLLAVGVASAGVLIASPTILQKETPPALMGRVSASATALPTVAQVAAPIAGAALARWQSVGFVFAAAGAALASLGLVVFALRPPVGVDVLGAATPVQLSTKGEPTAESPTPGEQRQPEQEEGIWAT